MLYIYYSYMVIILLIQVYVGLYFIWFLLFEKLVFCLFVLSTEAATRGDLYEKNVLKNFAKFMGKYLCQRLFFNKVADLRTATLLKKFLAQVFSFEFWKKIKNRMQNASRHNCFCFCFLFCCLNVLNQGTKICNHYLKRS